MPSKAFDDHLSAVLEDAGELLAAHTSLKTGERGRQHGLAALNRAAIVMCVSAWQAYVEEVVFESLEALRPAAGTPAGTWPVLNASGRTLVGRFNTPNSDQVLQLFVNSIGMPNVTANWSWKNCSPARASANLNAILTARHQSVHGTRPRPVVHAKWANWAVGFVQRLGRCTDDAVLAFLVETHGIAPAPWAKH